MYPADADNIKSTIVHCNHFNSSYNNYAFYKVSLKFLKYFLSYGFVFIYRVSQGESARARLGQ